MNVDQQQLQRIQEHYERIIATRPATEDPGSDMILDWLHGLQRIVAETIFSHANDLSDAILGAAHANAEVVCALIDLHEMKARQEADDDP